MSYQALTKGYLSPKDSNMPRAPSPGSNLPIPRPPNPSLAIVGPGRPRPPSTTLRTLCLATSGLSRQRGTIKRILAASGNTAIIPALLDHEATRGLPVCIDIPVFKCHEAPSQDIGTQIFVRPGFLTPGKPLPPTLWHLPVIPKPLLASLTHCAPECLNMSRNGWNVPWHSFSRTGRCQLMAHTSIGQLCIAKAPCAGRLILVAEALSRAKCGLRYHIPGTFKARPISHPITHLSVTNKE